MSEQYYRVKIEWPAPHFIKDMLSNTTVTHCHYDTRFYTTATDLRGVHLDIQAHLAKNYAIEGLNEGEDIMSNLSPDEILQEYSRTDQPLVYHVEVINDPIQVDLIDRAIQQHELLESLCSMISIGLVPISDGLRKPRFVFGTIAADLKLALAGVLRPFHRYDDTFEILRDLVEKVDEMIHELQIHTNSVIQQVKGV